MPPLHSASRIVRCATALGILAGAWTFPAVPAAAAARVSDPASSLLLDQTLRVSHAGEVAGTVVVVREGFLTGRDTLRGAFAWGADGRTLVLDGAEGRFEWWSREGGREQWHRSGEGGRPRRLPPHAWRKPAFSPDVTFGDLARLPFGYLEDAGVTRARREADTTVRLEIVPPPGFGLLYAALEATISGRPPLVRRLDFRGHPGRPSRTLEFVRYAALAGGLLPVELEFASADGLTRTRMTFMPAPADAPRDRATADLPPMPAFAVPRWEARDGRAP